MVRPAADAGRHSLDLDRIRPTTLRPFGFPAAARIRFLHDVDDDERQALMAGSAAFVLPSKPRPEPSPRPCGGR